MDLQTFFTLIEEYERLESPEAKQFLTDLVLHPAALQSGQYNLDNVAVIAEGYLERLRDAGMAAVEIDEALETLQEFMNQQPNAPEV